MFLTFWIVFLVVFIGSLLVYAIINQINNSSIYKRQLDINTQVLNLLKKSNFEISKIFYINDYTTFNKSNEYKKSIIIDNVNKKICFIDYQKGTMLKVDFNEILNYEIYENGSSVTTGGNIGGLGGGIFAAETNGSIKELKLIIRLKRYDTSQIIYDIISNTTFNIGINKSNEIYKYCISTLQEVVSFLEVVINENSINKK